MLCKCLQYLLYGMNCLWHAAAWCSERALRCRKTGRETDRKREEREQNKGTESKEIQTEMVHLLHVARALSPSLHGALRWITACQRGSQQRAAKIATHSSFNTSFPLHLSFFHFIPHFASVSNLCPFFLLSWSLSSPGSGSSVLTAVKDVGRPRPLDPINGLLSMHSSVLSSFHQHTPRCANQKVQEG